MACHCRPVSTISIQANKVFIKSKLLSDVDVLLSPSSWTTFLFLPIFLAFTFFELCRLTKPSKRGGGVGSSKMYNIYLYIDTNTSLHLLLIYFNDMSDIHKFIIHGNLLEIIFVLSSVLIRRDDYILKREFIHTKDKALI